MADLSRLLAEEELKENLSGRQIMAILDRLLKGALQPVLTLTNLCRRGLCDVLAQFSFDSRRRLGDLDRQSTIDSLFSAAVAGNQARHARLVLSMHLDRGIGSQIITAFLRETSRLPDIERRLLANRHDRGAQQELFRLARRLGCTQPHRLAAGLTWCRHYTSLYDKFKGMVVAKYRRFVLSQARIAIENSALPMDLQETIKNYMMAVSKALDKYNSNRGALTSYIQQWLKNERTNPEFDPRYAQSFGLSGGSRREVAGRYASGASGVNNFALSLSVDSVAQRAEQIDLEDSLAADDLVLRREHFEKMKRLAGWAPNARVAMLALGIPFMLESDELAALRARAP